MAVAILGAGYLGLNPPGFAAGTVALAFGLAASFPLHDVLQEHAVRILEAETL